MALTPITAKWRGKCACCGARFEGGTFVLHDAAARRCYLRGHEPEGSETLDIQATPAFRQGLQDGCAAELRECPFPSGTADAAYWLQGVERARL